MERPPRFDPPDSDPAHLKAWLSDYANGVLHDELAKSNVKQRVFVCPHSLPQTFEQDLYGHPARRGFDGVHLHGSNGSKAFTHSMCNILQHNLKEHSRETHKHLFPGYTNCPTLTTPNTFASQLLPSVNINTSLEHAIDSTCYIIENNVHNKTSTKNKIHHCFRRPSKIPQTDGNISLLSSSSMNSSILSSSSVSTLVQCSSTNINLPRIYFTIARSIFPKLKDLAEKLQNNSIDIAQISETWQDIHKQEHNDKIDILENRLGYKWYSYARPKYKDDGQMSGGGGSAILINQRTFLSSEIRDISVPKNLEIVWVKVVPKHKMRVKVFIICGIYSKPSSKTKTILNDHIATNYYLLKMKYQDVRFVFMGDFNDHKSDVILQLSPQLRQTVHYPTCGTHTLDLLITDLHPMYNFPTQDPPLLPDDPTHAAQSDHLGNLFIPRAAAKTSFNPRQYETISVRPMKRDQIDALGRVLVNENWMIILNEKNVDDKFYTFSNSLQALLDDIAPIKIIKIACDDPAWVNVRLKTMIRRRTENMKKMENLKNGIN